MSEPIKINISALPAVPSPTFTELITEVQRISYRDPEINRRLVEALRLLANNIEDGSAGLHEISTKVISGFDRIPSIEVKLDIFDRQHMDKK